MGPLQCSRFDVENERCITVSQALKRGKLQSVGHIVVHLGIIDGGDVYMCLVLTTSPTMRGSCQRTKTVTQ